MLIKESDLKQLIREVYWQNNLYNFIVDFRHNLKRLNPMSIKQDPELGEDYNKLYELVDTIIHKMSRHK